MKETKIKYNVFKYELRDNTIGMIDRNNPNLPIVTAKFCENLDGNGRNLIISNVSLSLRFSSRWFKNFEYR